MTDKELIKSRKLWRERELRFYKNWQSYKKRNSKSPRRVYWYSQYKNAHRLRIRRDRQIAKSRKVTGVSDRGIALIKEFEGFRSHAYKDPVGIWTIGYGETRGVRPGQVVSEKEASRQLRSRVNNDYFPTIRALPVFDSLKQNQVDALTSFVYNVGPGGVAPGTGVGRALRAKEFRLAADRLLDWNRGGGRELPGLTRRRKAERELFLR